MILLVCLCLCLVLAGLAFRQPIQATLEDFRLALFGVRVRVPTCPRGAPSRLVRPPVPSRHDLLPPVRVSTRAGPRPPCQTPTVPPHG
jgi:hypothetical protein